MYVPVRKILFLIILSTSMLTHAAEDQDVVLAIEWVDLLSDADLEAMTNPPEMTHDCYGWEEQLSNNSEAEAYMNAMQSFDVNPDLINRRVMIPGFVVPIAYNEERKVTEFFLVPFFGACIHLPPPPPNQIIYVTYERGVSLDHLYDAQVVHGMLTSETMRSDLADSAYRLEAEGVSVYSY